MKNKTVIDSYNLVSGQIADNMRQLLLMMKSYNNEADAEDPETDDLEPTGRSNLSSIQLK